MPQQEPLKKAPVKKQPTDHPIPQDVIDGLSAGDERAFRYVLSMAERIGEQEVLRKGIRPQDFEDITHEVLVEIISELNKEVPNRDGRFLARMIKRVVWRHAQRYRRQYNREADEVNENARPGTYLLPEYLDETPRELGKTTLATPLYRDTKTEPATNIIRTDILAIDDEAIRFLAKHPEYMHDLSPRRFEELIAAILKDLGYAVELTAEGADGGVDIFATQKSGIGESLLIVDCKRYSSKKHVGVEIVRALYGIGEQKRATMAMVATTSYFTRAAKEFQHAVKNRLSLRDYDHLVAWLNVYSLGGK
jgi:HJR/Mrr/RecB family endonuclease